MLGIVPARRGSKRLAGKNTRPLGGKPLVRWAIDAATAATALDRVVVSSDDPDVLDIARSVDSEMAWPRPDELASDTAPAIGYVMHVLSSLDPSATQFDAVAIVQPTSPFTTGADIDATVNLLSESGADTAVSVVRLDHAIHPAKLKRLCGNRLKAYVEEERGRMAEHELHDVYVRNCAVYVARRATLDGGQIIGADCRGYVMPRERSLDINDAFDFELAEFMFSKLQ